MVKSRLIPSDLKHGLVAQLGAHLICIQRVMGSNPISSTKRFSQRLFKLSFWVRIVQMNLVTFIDLGYPSW